MPKEPYFVAVGTWVEDRRDDRPDICEVFYGYDSVGLSGERRSYAEACELARKIAALLNEFYPRANNAPRAKKETA